MNVTDRGVVRGSDPLAGSLPSKRVGAGRKRLQGLSGPIAIALLVGAPAAHAAAPLSGIAQFEFEQQAQKHCPGEAIVWIEPRLHIYNVGTDRFYGQTRTGAYACLREAENAGYRTRSGL